MRAVFYYASSSSLKNDAVASRHSKSVARLVIDRGTCSDSEIAARNLKQP
jgi:C-terminal processing protease CtpA/Prc